MINLRNVSSSERCVLDAGDGLGRTVKPGEVGIFTEQCARELLASFPADWATATPPAPEAKDATP